MDWAKAKNILIVAFIFINLLLLYSVWFQPYIIPQYFGVSSEEINGVREELAKQGIDIHASIPRKAPYLPFLVMSYPETEPKECAAGFFGTSDISSQQSQSGESIIFKQGSERLIISETGRVSYYNRNQSQEQAAFESEEEVIKFAVQWLKSHNSWMNGLKLDAVTSLENLEPTSITEGNLEAEPVHVVSRQAKTVAVGGSSDDNNDYVQFMVKFKGDPVLEIQGTRLKLGGVLQDPSSYNVVHTFEDINGERQHTFQIKLSKTVSVRTWNFEIDFFNPGDSSALIEPDIKKAWVQSTEYQVSFYRTFKGAPIFGTSVDLYISHGNVEVMYACLHEPVRYAEASRPIITAVEALMRLAAWAESKKEVAGGVVDGIELGFYSIQSPGKDASEWETFPVWRLTYNGEHYYLNAYTGEMEE